MTVVYAKGFVETLEKSDGAVLAGQDSLFTITGGPVMVTEFVGIVTLVIGGIATCHIDLAVTEPAADVPLSTTVTITSDVAGTSYTFTTDALPVLTPTDAGAVLTVPRIAWLCPIGTIKSDTSAARTGNIKWYIGYIKLSQFSKVVAAA